MLDAGPWALPRPAAPIRDRPRGSGEGSCAFASSVLPARRASMDFPMIEVQSTAAAGSRWRPATLDDLPTIMTIQDQVHTLLPEREEVLADKLRLFGEGCYMLAIDERCLGYGIAHPWIIGDAPCLDAPLGTLPGVPECLFVHDVALLPEARGQGAGRAFIAAVTVIARTRGWESMAMVSVYETAQLWGRLGFKPASLPAHKLAPYGDTARYLVAPVS